jgi:nicotinamide-nucleotide amidase
MVEINEMISISDDKAISLTLWKLQNTVDLVIVTGGLGPTKDDVTKRRSVTILRTS